MVTVVPKIATFDQYNLKLNEFNDKVTMTWQDLQVNNNFYNLTLSCDGQQIHSHKVVVSSVCPMLRRILKQNTDEHPLIYFSGFKFEDLENLVKFMYQGEVKIAENDLNSFLNAAEYLQIEGIMKEIVESNDFTQNSNISSPNENMKDNRIKKVITSNNFTVDKRKYDNVPVPIRTYQINDEEGNGNNVDINRKDNLPLMLNPINVEETTLNEKNNLIDSEYNTSIPNKNDHILHFDLSDKQPKELTHSTKTNLALDEKNKMEIIKNAEFNCQNIQAQDEEEKSEYDLNSSVALIAEVKIKSNAQFSDDSQNYFCMKCSKKYINKRGLKNHEYSAHYEYECKQCDKKFNSTYTLKAHADSVHEGINFQCGQCNYKGMSKLTLKRHVAAIHENVRLPCNQCNFQARDSGYLKRHVNSIHKGIRHQCDECNKFFVEYSKLRRHVESIHEGIRYPCNSCDYFAKDKDSLRKHKKAHGV